MDKPALRRRLRQRRRLVTESAAARAAQRCAALLADSALWPRLRAIGLYRPGDGELDPTPVAHRARADNRARTLFLPRLCGASLEFAPWPQDAPLVANRFGIGEPQTAAVKVTSLDLLLLPTVGWTADGARLGMGGGFYDRCLGSVKASQRPLLVGLAYACQRCEDLRADPWDVQLDGVLTEEGWVPVSERLQRRLRAPRADD